MFNNFDKYLWRFNGLVISVIILILLAVTINSLFDKNSSYTIQQKPVSIVTDSEKEFHLGDQKKYSLSNFMFFPLLKKFEKDSLHLSRYKPNYHSETLNAMNYLVIDVEKSKSSWIWETNKILIVNDVPLCDTDCFGRDGLLKGIVFEIVKFDSNNNHYYDELDAREIQFYSPHNRRLTSIAKEVRRLQGYQTNRADSVTFVYENTKGVSLMKTLDMNNGVVGKEKEIAILKN